MDRELFLRVASSTIVVAIGCLLLWGAMRRVMPFNYLEVFLFVFGARMCFAKHTSDD